MTEIQQETPAECVIRKFGGPRVVAELLGLSRVQVNRWNYARSDGGASGSVPAKHHEALLRAASERGIDLNLEDLMPWLRRIGR